MKINDAKFTKGAASWSGLSDDGLVEIAFVGRSNVGKSSLINMLVGRKALARTSNTPGKTQEFNYYLINEQFYFLDLPGLGYAKVSKVQREKWERLIARYLGERKALKLVIHLIDSRHDATNYDRDIIKSMREAPFPYIIVMSKADKLSQNKQFAAKKRLNALLKEIGLEAPVIMTSAMNKSGRDEIWKRVSDVLV